MKRLFAKYLQIKETLSSLSQRQIEHRHGSLLALSHAIHRKLTYQHKHKIESTISNCNDTKRFTTILIEYLSDQQPLLVLAAINGIALIGSVIPLPLDSTNTEAMDVDGESKTFTKTHVANTIVHLLKSAHSRAKIREEAALCLGQLAIGDGAFFTQFNLDEFIKLIKLVKKNQLFFSKY